MSTPSPSERPLGRPPTPPPPGRDLVKEYAELLAWYAARKRLFNLKTLADETHLAHTTVKELFSGKARHLQAYHLDRIYEAFDRLLVSPRPAYLPAPPPKE